MSPATDRCHKGKSDFEAPVYIDLLKLSAADMRVLAGLADCDLPQAIAERRRHARSALTVRGHADFTGTTGATGRFIIYMLDVSTHGAGFLNSTFVHQDTRCRIRLALPDGESMAVEGRVRRCRLVRGRAHEVGIEFDHPIPEEMVNRLTSRPDQAAATAPRNGPAAPEPAAAAARSQPPASAIPVEVLGVLQQLGQALDAASGLGGTIKDLCRQLELPDRRPASAQPVPQNAAAPKNA